MYIGNREFNNTTPYIMGILNVTPDSFSDGGMHNNIDDVLRHTEAMINEGADIIDVGGESTRPFHIKISDEEEIERSASAIFEIKKRFDIPVSLDTYKAKVASAGIKAGADMINDIWGLKWDNSEDADSMANIVARNNVAYCLMHNRHDVQYTDYLADVVNDIEESINLAQNAGIDKDRIILDPGFGFAKDTNQNILLMNNVEKIVELGYPVLIGTSRKSMLGNTLDLPVNEREEATIATSVMGLMKGCNYFRVHNVKGNRRALDMTWAILKSKS